ncbi:ATP-binding protein [uncultured Erythrobacter sp.]|uniref:sensor histidine kinase n=1 Tax=uncultured Erythrobacter sp. TaxID=263913 RepID=UPI0026332007|nr:ATP-binding protein [uncultured Erythrobacter sp.]
MKRLLPSSLLSQVMVSVALALLVAQFVSLALLYRAGEERRETAILTAAAFQLVTGAERAARDRAIRQERGRRQGGAAGLPPRLRYTISAEPPAAGSDANGEGESEARLRAALLLEDIDPHAVAITIRRAGDDPLLNAFAEARPRFERRQGWREKRLYVAAIQREAGGQWEAARVLEPRRRQAALGGLIFQTLVTFGVLIAVLFFVMRRITRPLARLTERVGDFSREPGRVVQLEETGPSDTRHLIAAHNAMEARIAALLDEKDVMLGAIGHDLKTPLAALRVRIESVPDDAQRSKMAASIEDITATLDDILTLSRVGRDGAGVEPADLGALALGVAEEFEDLGEPVTILDPPRLVARVQVTWIKRALRNLASNAVRYGEMAEISAIEEAGQAVLRVDDRGPGIAPDRIAAMLEPFTRGEASRNRATGGAGLGLTLARAIAEQHGGQLVLENRQAGGQITGLRAEIRLPL